MTRYNGDERRSEMSQAVRQSVKHSITVALEEHEIEEQAWLAAHEKKDIAAHDTVCAKLEALSNDNAEIKGLIGEVKSVWDGIGAVGKGVFLLAKFVVSIGAILAGFWALVHFGGKS